MSEVSREKIYDALIAEGIEGLSKQYLNLHLLPLYQKKIAYGSKGFPWNSEICKRNINYKKGICPVAEELQDKTLGIIGDGRLGKMVEYLCQNIFKKVIVVDKDYGDKEKLFFESDIVSLHVDLNPSTYQMINKKYMQQFRKSIYLVNTSRGELVNEEDINELLLKDRISGYATDVLQTEYVEEKSILESNHKVLITPHIAGTSIEAQEKAYNRVLEKI